MLLKWFNFQSFAILFRKLVQWIYKQRMTRAFDMNIWISSEIEQKQHLMILNWDNHFCGKPSKIIFVALVWMTFFFFLIFSVKQHFQIQLTFFFFCFSHQQKFKLYFRIFILNWKSDKNIIITKPMYEYEYDTHFNLNPQISQLRSSQIHKNREQNIFFCSTNKQKNWLHNNLI